MTYLYAAASLFKAVIPAPFTRYAACPTYLRIGAATTAASMAIITTDAMVLVAKGVTGTAWSTTCAGKAVSGTGWYQISQVNNVSVQSLYGVPYVYAAAGLFKAAVVTPAAVPTPTPTIAPTPTPTAGPDRDPDPDAGRRPRPTPTPTPTAVPTATPAPTATPSPTPTPVAFLNMTEGIDISHWQGTIIWSKVAAAGKHFAYMKASEEHHVRRPDLRLEPPAGTRGRPLRRRLSLRHADHDGGRCDRPGGPLPRRGDPGQGRPPPGPRPRTERRPDASRS